MGSQITPQEQLKLEHKRRFIAKLEDYISQRKDTQIKPVENYEKILGAVQQRQEGEKFLNDQVRRNYATRLVIFVICSFF